MTIYIVIAGLVSSLSDAYNRERGLARSDFLTGIHNWQSFVELAEREVERAKRYKTNLTQQWPGLFGQPEAFFKW